MKKRTEAFWFLLHNTFLIIVCVKNTTKILKKFRFCWKEKNQNVLRNFRLCVFRILFNNDPQQISFNSAKKWLRKLYRNTTFSSKMHNGENALFEVLLYLYKQCKHHTKICIFCIEMDSFWNHVIYVWIVWSFLYMEMSTTQNLKKYSPEFRPAPPPPP